jgi:hypothetical protein
MTASPVPRFTWFAGICLMLNACDDPAVRFGHPFPAAAPDLIAFPARHRGRYVAPDDSTRELGISADAIWTAQLSSTRLSRHQLDSMNIPIAGKGWGSWRTADHRRYRLRAAPADSVWLDAWSTDTLCKLGPAFNGHLRWWRGAYYLSNAVGFTETHWNVERFVSDGRGLSWESLGSDTLRIAVLPPEVVRRAAAGESPRFLLSPTTRQQERQIATYAGLWKLNCEYVQL